MQDGELKDKAVEVIGRILSESAFIFTDPLDEAETPDRVAWDAQGVALEFSGHCRGRVSLWAGSEFLRYAAANMLGVDEESAEAEQKGMDALKEILNIVVGNLLTAVYGADPVFDLGIPRMLGGEKLQTDAAEENTIWLQAEGNPVMFVMELENGK